MPDTRELAAEALKLAFHALPPLAADDTFWNGKQRELRERFAGSDIDELLPTFLTWPEIATTMFVGECAWIEREHEAVKRWHGYPFAIVEDAIGRPPWLGYYPWTSGSMVHSAYHVMMWEATTGKSIRDVESIIEVGGGYGGLAKVMRRAGFRGTYTIYDLPEFSLLQRYYLDSCAIEGIAFRDSPPVWPVECELLIGLWSLSEMQSEMQMRYLHNIRTNHYLLAMNNELWEGRDSRATLLSLPVQRTASPALGSFYLLA